ncbi:prenyltransferase/squalene oxidase repeat-containing protein [Pyrococcus yayanosii]|uniref:Putative squalene-hopene cyclase n=1 Tax=Pyrococcus yayanosii (strain CH1 / JCM 16557) TaxID=529709 RepID=F8AER1_PYRYC|nr:prenyltransferase/squalene oxidase repeat-containing protein [Pyrococcus yayanosii]AEH24743.1 putative squalene-hopene cyclase [Pyrococcus yayanosii CH1]
MKSRIPVTIILVLIMLAAPVSSIPVLQGSIEFLSGVDEYPYETHQLSLLIMALSSAHGKVEGEYEDELWKAVDELLQRQNSDWGWGYYKGSISNVPDTAYALMALNRAKNVYPATDGRRITIEVAIKKGMYYLTKAFNGDGWGYIWGSPTDFYPTLMATLALAELGEDSVTLEAGIRYLKENRPTDKKELALWTLALFLGGEEVPEDAISSLESALSGDVSDEERALITYVLLRVKGLNFEVAKSLSILEENALGDDVSFWRGLEASAYATMAFSLVSDKLIEAGEDYLGIACSRLPKLQNEDGGWGPYLGFKSDAKSTYYALHALKVCNPMSPAIGRGLEFMRNVMKERAYWIRVNGYLPNDYLFAVTALAEFGNLTKDEKEEAISLIKGARWGNIFGRQPLTTALAIKALLALGVSPTDSKIVERKRWLLGLSNGGWGPYVQFFFTGYMAGPSYADTLIIIDALSPISTEDELKPHLTWLLNADATAEWLRVYAMRILKTWGIDPGWTIEKPDYDDVLLDSMIILYLSAFPEVPTVNIYTVMETLRAENFTVSYTNLQEAGKIVAKGLERLFEKNVTIKPFTEIGDGNYVVVAPFGTMNVSEYNRNVKLEVEDNKVIINGREYKRDKIIAIIPGRTRTGVILFVLLEEDALPALETLFSSGILRYLHGGIFVLTWKDTNGNGRAELEELEAEFL